MGGISFSNRRGKSLGGDRVLEDRVEAATDVVKRQTALEEYVVSQVRNMWNYGKVTWNPQESARSLAGSIGDINDLQQYAGEGISIINPSINYGKKARAIWYSGKVVAGYFL